MNVNSEMLFMSIHGGHKIVQNPKRAMNTKKAKNMLMRILYIFLKPTKNTMI